MQPQFVIQIGDQRVRIARSSGARDEPMMVVAEFSHDADSLVREAQDVTALAEQLETILPAHLPPKAIGRLVIPASWCFMHQVQVPDGAQYGAGAAFEFEQFAPVPFEHLTCCPWRTNEEGGFIVAVFTESMHTLLSAIEKLGFTIESATVDSCVLWDSLDSSCDKSTALLFLDEHHASITINIGAQNRILRSLRIPEECSVEHVRHHVALSMEVAGVTSANWHLTTSAGRWSADDLIRMVPECTSATQQLEAADTIQHLIESAGSRSDFLNLRTGNLGSPRKWRPLLKQLERCSVFALIVMALLSVRFSLEGSRYTKAAGVLQAEQCKLYERVFPGSPIPPGSALRIQSERIKLEGLTERTGASGSPIGIGGMEAFALLHELTNRLPKSAKVNIEEVVLEQDGVRVSGLTTGHQIAGDWVQQLNESAFLRADPPRTKLRADSTVEFRVHVKRAENDESR